MSETELKKERQAGKEPGGKFPGTNGGNCRLRQWAFSIRPDESKPAAALRSWFRILLIIIHEFTEAAITLRASALTYTIILSMVPMLAMGTAVLKGMGSGNRLRVAAYRLLDQLGPGPVEKAANTPGRVEGLQIPAGTLDRDATAPAPAQNSGRQAVAGAGVRTQPATQPLPRQSLNGLLRNALDTIFNYVDQTNFTALGAFGIVGLLLSIILVMSTIEEAMNAIWHCRKRRSFLRKTMNYLALLILLPISINVALAGDAVLESPKIMARLHALIPSAWAVTMLLKFLPFLFIVLSLMVMYLFLPNVKVKTHAAFIGAVFAALFWLIVQWFYFYLQIGVARYNAIYGSFASVPLFLIWIQVGWTFILSGALLAYAVQNRKLYHLPGTSVTPQRKLQLAFDILDSVYRDFANRETTTVERLAQTHPGEQPGEIMEVAELLTKGGILHRIEDGETTFVPAAPAENLEAREVIRLILGHEDLPTTGGRFSRAVLRAAEAAIPGGAFPVPPDSPAAQPTISATDKEQ
ncbi:MAG: YihY/virulence factor BrkB family protein [Deltaproteobacteria bacterium]|nr:YihY/virulence factor BrkB family protein [Deltaproteobacteria bacterium]